MRISNTVLNGRQAWELDNDELSEAVLKGGGHIASLKLKEKGAINPLWVPEWRTIEPWQYKPQQATRYGSKLLASIAGHNLCLGWFGDPSADELKAGMGCHGEAPVARWRLTAKKVTRISASLTYGCDLPVAEMSFSRTLSSRHGSSIIEICEEVVNLARRDVPYTMCEHVTLGPPFLEKDATFFDMPATAGHTFPRPFGDRQRLATDTGFAWPQGPGADGKIVDLRRLGNAGRASSDFSTQLMDPGREDAWFSAVNPRLGLMLACVWRRSDFPWLGNWEENRGRKAQPWAGKSLTRGMEFANTPFPVGLRQAVTMGTFHGRPTFRWMTARGRVQIRYAMILVRVPVQVAGVNDIRAVERGFEIDFKTQRSKS